MISNILSNITTVISSVVFLLNFVVGDLRLIFNGGLEYVIDLGGQEGGSPSIGHIQGLFKYVIGFGG